MRSRVTLPQQQRGVLLMFAGLSGRVAGAAVSPNALAAWLADEVMAGSLACHTLSLFRNGYLNTVDGDRYLVTADGWRMVNECYRAMGEEDDDELAQDALPDVLILLGEAEMKAEAQHLAASVLGYPADRYRSP
jgi:hypothetical protein